MKNIIISSWNVNKTDQCTVKQLSKVICEEDSDILFLHEFPTNKISELIDNINCISKNKYDLFTAQTEFEVTYNITIALIKSNISNIVSMVNINSSNLTKDIPFKLRLIELKIVSKNKDILVLGIHCPIYTKTSSNISRNTNIDIFWKKFIEYAKSKELMIIGDLNVNLKKRNRFTNNINNLFNSDYIDLDIKEKKNTFIGDTRIDYALIRKSLNDSQHIQMIEPKYINANKNSLFELSDHKMISINMEV